MLETTKLIAFNPKFVLASLKLVKPLL